MLTHKTTSSLLRRMYLTPASSPRSTAPVVGFVRERGRDNLFAHQRPAITLDHVQVRIALVGTVHGDVERHALLQRHQRNAERHSEIG